MKTTSLTAAAVLALLAACSPGKKEDAPKPGGPNR